MSVTTYRIEDEPTFVRDDGEGPLPGHYEAVFVRDGERIERYLTDKGRAEILRAMENGPAELSRDEFETHSVEPSLNALLQRMEREGGEGA
ncbi:MAG: hypothetical protein ACXVQU_00825 [Actinomycetota bacterium]